MSKVEIMIVEDEPIAAMRLQRSVENMGFSVISTSNSAEQAIRDLESMHPDLIIMDIMLHGEMDGIDEISKGSGTLYDPEVIDACKRVFDGT